MHLQVPSFLITESPVPERRALPILFQPFSNSAEGILSKAVPTLELGRRTTHSPCLRFSAGLRLLGTSPPSSIFPFGSQLSWKFTGFSRAMLVLCCGLGLEISMQRSLPFPRQQLVRFFELQCTIPYHKLQSQCRGLQPLKSHCLYFHCCWEVLLQKEQAYYTFSHFWHIL